MKCKKALSLLLSLVMVLGLLPVSAFAAEGTELASGLTSGTFVDTTAVSEEGYEYTIVGSDGSEQTVSVLAVEDNLGNSVTPTTIAGGYKYTKATSITSGETYLLVNDTTAITGDLGTTTVAINNDTITGDYSASEWAITSRKNSSTDYYVKNSAGNYLTIGASTVSTSTSSSAYVAADVRNGTVTFSKSVRELLIFTTTYYLYLSGTTLTSQKNIGTSFTLYQKGDEVAGGTAYAVDTSGLNTLISSYAGLSSSNYTDDSWANYETALNAAKALQNPTDMYDTEAEANVKLAEVVAAHNALVAAYEALVALESVEAEISWTRTQDDSTNTVYNIPFANTKASVTYDGVTYAQYNALTWEWSTLEKLVNDEETKQQEVWNYVNTLGISAASITTGGSTWETASVHKISGVFEWPEDYELSETTIDLKTVNDEYYQPIYDYIEANGLTEQFGDGKVFPVNDDVYVVMWVEDKTAENGGKPTVNNINDYLLFWTGTSGKGIWTRKGNTNADWARTTPATFISGARQGVRAFYDAWPNAVGTNDTLTNTNVSNMSASDTVRDYLGQSDKWYTLTDTTAINSIMRNNYPDGIEAGAKVHLDLYVFNNDGEGGIDQIGITLLKK